MVCVSVCVCVYVLCVCWLGILHQGEALQFTEGEENKALYLPSLNDVMMNLNPRPLGPLASVLKHKHKRKHKCKHKCKQNSTCPNYPSKFLATSKWNTQCSPTIHDSCHSNVMKYKPLPP